MRDFSLWLSTFTESIASYSFYVDFKKVFANVEKIKTELSILNSLVGSKNIEFEFSVILEKYPEVLKCIPLLLAVRKFEIYASDIVGLFSYNFLRKNQSTENYIYFMRKTGLFELLSNHIIGNLKDYVTGIEVGLDSNARKNRCGSIMESLVESYLIAMGVSYFRQLSTSEISAKWNIDLSAISNKGTTEKVFDFVVKTDRQLYVFETNFYAGGGSKLNETARSYKTLAQEIATISGLSFIWITDGGGWKSARNNLRETFDIMEHLYNIKDLDNGILEEVIR